MLFGDALNYVIYVIIVGDGFPVPVILEQNHIAAGDKMLFPFGKSKNALHFWRDGEPVPYGEKWRLWGYKFQFTEQSRTGRVREVGLPPNVRAN